MVVSHWSGAMFNQDTVNPFQQIKKNLISQDKIYQTAWTLVWILHKYICGKYISKSNETVFCFCRMTRRRRGWISWRGKRKTSDFWMKRMPGWKAKPRRRLDLEEKWLVPKSGRCFRMRKSNRSSKSNSSNQKVKFRLKMLVNVKQSDKINNLIFFMFQI